MTIIVISHSLSSIPVASPVHYRLLVQFDGSLRKPSDPGFSTASLGWMASCAACIYNDEVGELIKLGGKEIEIIRDSSAKTITSGSVEYEGLLLALEGVSSFLQQQNNAADNNNLDVSTVQVVVQGDCKTVIQQMQGRSTSRKLDYYHQQAEHLLRNDVVLRNMDHSIVYEHIPRAENVLCDRLCAAILQRKEMEALEHVQKQVIVQNKSSSSILVADDEIFTPPNNNKKRAKAQYFDPETETSLSLIPVSKRPELYRALAAPPSCSDSVSMANHYYLLFEVAQRLRSEIDTVWSKADTTQQPSSSQLPNDYVSTLQARALAYEWTAIKHTGKRKELSRFENKHRYLWKKHRGLVDKTLDELTMRDDVSATLNLTMITSASHHWPQPIISWCEACRESRNLDCCRDREFWHWYSYIPPVVET